MAPTTLPSWRPGPTRDAIEIFLDAAEMLPIEQRVAVFDVDGTLWCERPQQVMVEFLRAELRRAVEADPALARRPEYAAALEWDRAAIARLGPVNVVIALLELEAGATSEAFAARVRDYFASARHPDRGVPLSQMRYRPMLELIAELRARHFDVFVATGSGVDFVRSISHAYFGVRPEGVVGSQVGYEWSHVAGVPTIVRTKEIVGDPNEGPAKITNVQRQLGRRPILAAGNSRGDREMLEYTQAFAGPSLALLLDHDDADREYRYASVGATTSDTEPMATVAARSGWTIVSMKDDWSTVFADA